MRVASTIHLSDSDRAVLERWANGSSTPARLVLRSKIVLLAASGLLNKEIARELHCGNKTVCLWRNRFSERGIAGIEKDAPRSPQRVAKSAMLVQQIVHTTLHESPPQRAHWTTRSLAAALGTSPAMIQRVWKVHGLTRGQRPTNSAS